jgi:hypothetical protein
MGHQVLRQKEIIMVSMKVLDKRLKKIGCHYPIWGRSEVCELANIVLPDEEIAQVINGYYEGGFGLLCVTNNRVLLVDKKPFALTVEDLRYDMIAEVDYGDSIIMSNIHILTPMRSLNFTSWSRTRLRKSMSYIQERVMEMRNQGFLAEQFHGTKLPQKSTAKGERSQGVFGSPMLARVLRETIQHLQPPASINASIFSRSTSEDIEANPVTYIAIPRPSRLINPYHKAPLLARRRRYPSYY